MAKNLVIVESPAKAKTIEKFLGKEFVVASSFGHISDLPLKKGPYVHYSLINKVQKNLDSKKKAVIKTWSRASMIIPDFVGQTIAVTYFNSLKLKEVNTKRIVFHEITETAIKKAVNNPRKIDENLSKRSTGQKSS